jgi:hypothetical protein
MFSMPNCSFGSGSVPAARRASFAPTSAAWRAATAGDCAARSSASS